MYSILNKEIISAKFPQTRYQGSKLKLLDWIWDSISYLDFESVGDVFGGTGAVSYMFKINLKSVIFNDIQLFNYYTGLSLIENSFSFIEYSDLDNVFSKNTQADDKVRKLFKNIYFTDDENKFIDNYIANLRKYYSDNKYKYSSLLWCLFQACIIKRPFNLFHRKNLYMRMNDVERSFGNKTTWDRPFEVYIRKFANEINNAIFDNGKHNRALNMDALEIEYSPDLVYIDTPYVSKNGVSVDYHHFYHFLEGLCIYDRWEDYIDYSKKHHPLKRKPNPWNDKDKVTEAFRRLIAKYKESHIVISYRSDGIPSIETLTKMVADFKNNVMIYSFGEYKYVLSNNGNSKEMLIVGYD